MRKLILSSTIIVCFFMTFVLSMGEVQAESTTTSNQYKIYVSPTGNDSNDGTIERPLATVQHALDLASPGTSVILRHGVYYENITINKSGNQENGYIKIIPYKGEHAAIDGSKTIPNGGANYLIRIEKKSYIHIEGLEFRNLNLDYAKGLYILNGSQYIVVKDNSFHDINTTKLDPDDFGSANAISVKSYDENLTNHDITIDSNQIYNCVLGFSEALVLSGNTVDFQVTNNTINNVTNIGIDIAGHYGDYHGDPATNQARHGVVEGNLVINCKSDYGSGAASGIYIDGGRNVIVKNNIVTDCDYGITIGCETPGKTASKIDVTSNIIYKNQKSGISVGGYSTEVGSVTDCRITSNKTYRNNLSGTCYQSEMSIKVCEDIEISGNTFYGAQTNIPDFSKDKTFYPILYNTLPAKNVTLSKNVYFTWAGIHSTYFRWNDEAYIGFKNYKNQTSLDLSSEFYDPLFTNPERGDLKFKHFDPLIKVDASNINWIKYVDFYLPLKILITFTVTSDARSLYLIYESTNSDNDISIYIDSDVSASTGYKISKWKNAGADYLIENGILYKYTGNGDTWSFHRIMNIQQTVGASASKYQIPLSLIDAFSGKNIGIGTISKMKVQLPSKSLPMYSFFIK